MAERSPYPHLPTVLTGLVLAIGAVLGVFLPDHSTSPGNNNGSAQLCPVRSIQENVDSADLILTGMVFAVVPGEPYAKVLITPQRVLRGVVPKNGIVLLALPEQTGGGSVSADLHFSSMDEPYLLFLKSSSDGTYTTSQCDGSRLLGDGLTTEEQLELGKVRTSP